MYAKGMTTRQISDTIEDIYGFDVSEGFVFDVTDKLLPQIEEWQNRPLDSVYPVVYIDAIHYSVKDNGIIRKMAAYVILGLACNRFIHDRFAPARLRKTSPISLLTQIERFSISSGTAASPKFMQT